MSLWGQMTLSGVVSIGRAVSRILSLKMPTKRGNHLSMSIVLAPNLLTNHSHALLYAKQPTWNNLKCHPIHSLRLISTITVLRLSTLMLTEAVITILAVLISQASKTVSRCKNFAGNNCRRTCEMMRSDVRPELWPSKLSRNNNSSSAVRTAIRLLIIDSERVHLSDKVSD